MALVDGYFESDPELRSVRYVRTRGGEVVHVEGCKRAKNGAPWRWAEGKAWAEIFLSAPWCAWATCCCGFVGFQATVLKQKLGLLPRTEVVSVHPPVPVEHSSGDDQ